MFEQTILLFHEELTENSIRFYSNIDPPDLTIKVDKKLFEQVLINLIKNAIEATGNGGSIRLEAYLINGLNEIKVINKGPAISEEDLIIYLSPFLLRGRKVRA